MVLYVHATKETTREILNKFSGVCVDERFDKTHVNLRVSNGQLDEVLEWLDKEGIDNEIV